MKTNRARLLMLLGLTVLLAGAFPAAAADSSGQPAPEPLAEPASEPLEEPLFVPEPLQMGDCITCVGYYETDVHWGVGANCAQSLQSLQNQVNAAASAFCQNISWLGGVCDSQLVITGQCWYKAMTGEYITDGYLAHGCFEGDFFCPEW